MNNIDLQGIDFHKYIVIKQDDLYKHASEQDMVDLSKILKTIRVGRKEVGKKTDNKYLVINIDEDYAKDVIEILKKNNHWK